MGGVERDQVVAAFPAARFPRLADFLRGYLHVDFGDEHGSPENAGRAFARDASPEERAGLGDEWQEFVRLTAAMSDDQVAAVVVTRLGAGWQPPSRAELANVLTLASAPTRR